MATASLPKTKCSTRRLSEVARHIVVPAGIASTGWPAVERKAVEFGDEFDQWQSDLGRVVLGKREDGMYAATVGGVQLSIPRQVAKTWLVGRIVFVMCVLFPGLKVVWTAHHTRTTTQTFNKLYGYSLRKKVAPHISYRRRTNGQQEIGFANGSVLMFGARETGFGRGFDEVDIEVFDEAQILSEKALEDMVAATNQSRHPHGALLFYMGTPPRPSDPSDAFKVRRSEALSFKVDGEGFGPPVEGEDALYVECSADPDADPDDRRQWAIANPSYPHRTPLQSMLRLRKNLPSDDSWKREALGVWDEDADSERDISLTHWALLVDELDPETLTDVRICLDAPPKARMGVFSMAGRRPDGRAHIQFRLLVPATDRNDKRTVKERVVDFAAKLATGHDTAIILPPNSPARAWKADLEAAGVPLDEMTAGDYGAACELISSEVEAHAVTHRNQPEMNRAVEGLQSRVSGDVNVWTRRKSTENIAPFVAATCALYRVPELTIDPVANVW